MPSVSRSISASPRAAVTAARSELGAVSAGASTTSAGLSSIATRHPLGEQIMRFQQRLGKPVDFLQGIVKTEGSAAGGGNPIAGQERLGAMRPGAHGHSGAVDHGCDIVGMGAGHVEGQDSSLAPCSTVNGETVYVRQPLVGVN